MVGKVRWYRKAVALNFLFDFFSHHIICWSYNCSLKLHIWFLQHITPAFIEQLYRNNPAKTTIEIIHVIINTNLISFDVLSTQLIISSNWFGYIFFFFLLGTYFSSLKLRTLFLGNSATCLHLRKLFISSCLEVTVSSRTGDRTTTKKTKTFTISN